MLCPLKGFDYNTLTIYCGIKILTRVQTKMNKPISLLVLFLTLVTGSKAQSNQITIDENFSDWSASPIFTDSQNDQSSGEIDFTDIWISNDNKNLFVRFSTGKEIVLAEDNDITIYIDSDNNASTGVSVNGIGAELSYNFGKRKGRVNGQDVYHNHIGLFAAPTVSSTQFEIAISRNITVNGFEVFPFSENTIKILIKDNGSGNDAVPNNGGIEYTFSNTSQTLPEYSINKKSSDYLRIVTYNVEHDGLLNADKKNYFERILKAVNPDIVGFQELTSSNADDTKNKVNEFLPGTWYASKPDYDRVLVSKYVILTSDTIDTKDYYESDYFLLNTQSKIGVNTLVIVAHPKCCNEVDNNGVSSDDKRATQFDAIMSFIKRVKDGKAPITLAANSPIVILGDMNLVGDSQQQRTLLTGDIVNNNNYVADFNPDWDETALEDAKPITTGMPGTFTSYDDYSSYSPGRLDYIVYTGSVLHLQNSYVLYTGGMSSSALNNTGLLSTDTKNASDHMPVVADFTYDSSTGIKNESLPTGFKLEQNYPNPFNPSTTIKYAISQPANVEFTIYDMLGKEIWSKNKGYQTAGNYRITFNSTEKQLSSGVYLLNMKAISSDKSFASIKKMLLMK